MAPPSRSWKDREGGRWAYKHNDAIYFVNGAVSAQGPLSYHAGGPGSLGALLGGALPIPPWAWWVVGTKVVVLEVVLKVVGWKWEKLLR